MNDIADVFVSLEQTVTSKLKLVAEILTITTLSANDRTMLEGIESNCKQLYVESCDSFNAEVLSIEAVIIRLACMSSDLSFSVGLILGSGNTKAILCYMQHTLKDNV